MASLVCTVVYIHASDSVHARIGPGRDGRMPNRSVARKNVDSRLWKPGTALPKGCERWHGHGVAIEVIPTHAIQDEQHNYSRPGKTCTQDRQYPARRSRGPPHAKRSGK